MLVYQRVMGYKQLNPIWGCRKKVCPSKWWLFRAKIVINHWSQVQIQLGHILWYDTPSYWARALNCQAVLGSPSARCWTPGEGDGEREREPEIYGAHIDTNLDSPLWYRSGKRDRRSFSINPSLLTVSILPMESWGLSGSIWLIYDWYMIDIWLIYWCMHPWFSASEVYLCNCQVSEPLSAWYLRWAIQGKILEIHI